MRRCSVLLVFALLLLPAGSRAEESPVQGAKDLFYDPAQSSALGVRVQPSKPPAPPPRGPAGAANSARGKTPARRPVKLPAVPEKAATSRNRGLHYWIELEEPGGEGTYVSSQHVFRSGQRIRIHFVSNTDGRILLIQMGSSGTSSVLFPDTRTSATDNRLKAGEDRILPGESYWFRFDSNPGTERLIALFAGDSLDLERFPVKPQMGPSETKALLQTVSHVQGSKDLVIETETRTASEVGTYGINLKGEPVILEILLEHR